MSELTRASAEEPRQDAPQDREGEEIVVLEEGSTTSVHSEAPPARKPPLRNFGRCNAC